MALPQLGGAAPFITDGGLETTLVFLDGIDLPDFASFPLLDSDDGRERLAAYFTPYLAIAEQAGTGFVLDTATWRANPDWGERLGYYADQIAAVNRGAVEFARGLAAQHPDVECVVNGVIGPRGDGYVVGSTMSPAEAALYHSLQVGAFADAGVDMVTAVTMTYADEAIGVVRAATSAGVPVVVSFTVETDGRLPSGQTLGEAITQVDDATGDAAEYFMINCAHPTHFPAELTPDASWAGRIRGLRANASRLSHAELDVATELDRGDIPELAGLYADLTGTLDLRVLGGCCGTDHEHVAAIAAAVRTV